MDFFPIDIEYKNIITWVEERRKISKDWLKRLKAGQLKLNELLEQTSQIKDAKVVEYIQKNKDQFSYYEVHQTVQMLQSGTDSQQKTFFGGYTSQIIKDWLALDQFYRKDQIYIGNIQKILNQNIQFEIPSIKKSISYLEKQISDSQQKIVDYKHSKKQTEQNFANNCQKVGVPGVNVEQEVSGLISQLPTYFSNIVALIQNPLIEEALKYYYDFSAFNSTQKENKKLNKLEVLEYLIKYGDDTVEVMKRRNKGEIISEQEYQEIQQNKYNQYTQIQNKSDEKIKIENFDIKFEVVESGNNKTNLDNQKNQEKIVEESKENNICWDIQLVNEEQKNNVEASDQKKTFLQEIQQIGTKQISIVQCETILSDRFWRNQLFCQISELYCFYLQRVNESQQYSLNSLVSAYQNGDNEKILEVSIEKLKKYRDLINQCTLQLQDHNLRQLFIIKEQPKQSQRIAQFLNQFLKNKDKFEDWASEKEKKIIEYSQQIAELKNKLQQIISYVLKLKDFVEIELTKLIKKDIHLIGEINKLDK